MQTWFCGKESSKRSAPLRSLILRWCRGLYIIPLLGVAVLLWAVSTSLTTFAQTGNLIQNANFETGNLAPWARFVYNPNDPGIVKVEPCCANHTPGGTWNAYIQPQGQYVEMYQWVPVSANRRYRLGAWVSTGPENTTGMTAYLRWWSNAQGGFLGECGSTRAIWPNYVKLTEPPCDLVVPSGTTQLNVHLAGTAPSGRWAVTDDWTLTQLSCSDGCNDFVNGELRVDQTSVNRSRDYRTRLYVSSRPTGSGGYTAGWLGVDLARYDGTLYSAKFSQVGFLTDINGVRWFVYSEAGVQCLQGAPVPGWGNRGCWGNYGDRATIGNWQRVELVTYTGQGFWIARVYDQNNNPLDVVKIMSSSVTIYRALATTEEAHTLATDPYLTARFYHSHPQYMVWGTGFQEWPASSGGNNNRIWTWPQGICDFHYGATVNLLGDPRYWFAGTGGSTCSRSPLF